MNWGAHKADVRIAAKNSVTMRAALRASINAQAIYEAYQETHPFVTDNITQDRARARAWAMLHVKIDNEPIKAALTKIYAEGFLLGLDASSEAIKKAEKTYSKFAITKADEYIDWANWKPGNRAAALLYRPVGAFEKILSEAGIVSKTIAKAGYDRIGTALADSVAAGFSPGRAAKVITAKIGDPARALTIAITEQNRAMSMATMQNYQEYGLEKMEWSGANPCDICAPNEGQVVTIGQPFNSGATQPPVHPNCRCALLPVLDDALYAEPSDGMNLMPIEGATAPAAAESLVGLAQFNALFDKGKYRVLTKEERYEFSMYQSNDDDFMALMFTEDRDSTEIYQALRSYKGSGYEWINSYLRTKQVSTFTEAAIKEKISYITKAMKNAPGLPDNITTWRAVKNAELDEFLSKLTPGKVWADKGFVSTTMKKDFAEDWTKGDIKWLIEIENPAGTKGVMLDGLVFKSDGTEAEWLLPKNTKFEVLEIDKTNKTMKVRVKQ